MLDFLTSVTLFGSVIAFWLITLIMIAFLFISESEKNGFIAAIAAFVFGFFFYFKGGGIVILGVSYPLLVGYFIIGLLFAIIKTFFGGYKYQKKLIEAKAKGDSKSYWPKRDSLKGNVFRWISIWPVSLLHWIFTDLMYDIFSAVWSYVSSFFEMIDKWGQKFYSDSDEAYKKENTTNGN
jgi:hypothetical protein